jgi:hypothetical protein
MRALLWVPLSAACSSVGAGASDLDDSDDFVASVDDASPAPPAACEGPSAELLFFGADPNDVIVSGEALPAETGSNGGAHVSLGLTVSAPAPEVAWRIDLFDVETEERVGGAGEGVYSYTALSYWTEESCTGYLPNARVCLGDCGNADLACTYDGHTLRAEAYTTVIGEATGGDPQITAEFVLAGDCS